MPQLTKLNLVPRYLIRKICEKNGVRLFKRPLFVAPHENIVRSKGTGIVKYSENIETTIERCKVVLNDPRLLFSNWEYRFWCVECNDAGPLLVTCRTCNASYFHKEGRKTHLNENGCATKLLKAFSLLKRDKLCIVCDTKTTNEEWGVPMCDTNVCKDIFCHEESQSTGLENALIMVKNSAIVETKHGS
jgi:hypothetical protein